MDACKLDRALAEKTERVGSPLDDCVILGVVGSPVKRDIDPRVTPQTLSTRDDQVSEEFSGSQSLFMDNSAFPLFTEKPGTQLDDHNVLCVDVSASAGTPVGSDQSGSSLGLSDATSPSLLQSKSPGNVAQATSSVDPGSCGPSSLPVFTSPERQALDPTLMEHSREQPSRDMPLEEGGAQFESGHLLFAEEDGHDKSEVSTSPAERVHARPSDGGGAKKKRKLILHQSSLSQHVAVEAKPVTFDRKTSPLLLDSSQEHLHPHMPLFIPATPWARRKPDHFALGESDDDETSVVMLPETDCAGYLLPNKRSHPYLSSSEEEDEDDDYVLVPPTTVGSTREGIAERPVVTPDDPDVTQSICPHSPPAAPGPPLDADATQSALKSAFPALVREFSPIFPVRGWLVPRKQWAVSVCL